MTVLRTSQIHRVLRAAGLHHVQMDGDSEEGFYVEKEHGDPVCAVGWYVPRELEDFGLRDELKAEGLARCEAALRAARLDVVGRDACNVRVRLPEP